MTSPRTFEAVFWLRRDHSATIPSSICRDGSALTHRIHRRTGHSKRALRLCLSSYPNILRCQQCMTNKVTVASSPLIASLCPVITLSCRLRCHPLLHTTICSTTVPSCHKSKTYLPAEKILLFDGQVLWAAIQCFLPSLLRPILLSCRWPPRMFPRIHLIWGLAILLQPQLRIVV